MPLTAADLTRIYKYRAFQLGSGAGNNLTSTTVLTLIQEQMNGINSLDALLGTTFAIAIQADLTEMDALDLTLKEEEGSTDGALRKADVLEYLDDKTRTIRNRFSMLKTRVSDALSQTYNQGSNPGVTVLERG